MIYVQRQAQAGFTLMELLIAITILAIIGTVGIPAYFGYVERARRGKAETTVRMFKQAIEIYQAQVGKYPQTLKDLVRAPTDPADRRKWQKGGYLGMKKVPSDPWGNKYKYRVTLEAENPYKLYSYGSEKGKNTPKEDWISAWDE